MVLLMKWPNTLTVVRHGESAFNALKALKEADQGYLDFRETYELMGPDNSDVIERAETIHKAGKFTVRAGDHDTQLSEVGQHQAEVTGERLKDLILLPDVIFVSPYIRTQDTLTGLTVGWPELATVKRVEEERIREREHGLALLYNDWRIFHALHPEQRQLHDIEGSYWYRYPQGENIPDARERIRSWLGAVTRDYYEQNILAVTHHLTILGLRANLERMGAPEFAELDEHHKPVNCGVTIYRGDPKLGQDGRLVLDKYNQKLY